MKNQRATPDFSHRYGTLLTGEPWYIDDIDQIARGTEAMIQVFADQFVDTEARATGGLIGEINYFALQSIANNLKDIRALCEAELARRRDEKAGVG